MFLPLTGNYKGQYGNKVLPVNDDGKSDTLDTYIRLGLDLTPELYTGICFY